MFVVLWEPPWLILLLRLGNLEFSTRCSMRGSNSTTHVFFLCRECCLSGFLQM